MSGAAPSPARPTVVPFAAVSFAYFAYAGLMATYGPLWFQSLGYSTFAIGVLTSLQSATRLFSPYAWGWVADHTGKRERLLTIASTGSLVASVGYFMPVDYAWIAAVTVVLFVCTAGVIPISEATLALRVSSGGTLDVGRYGRVRMWGSVGFITAAATSGYLLESAGVGRFPLLVSILLVLLVVAAWRLPGSSEPAHAPAIEAGALAVLRQPVVAWFFAGVFLTVLAHTSLYAFYSLYLASLGYGKGEIGLLWAIGVVAEVVWFWFQGRWLHRLPMHGWLAVAALASALRFALIAAFGAWVAVLVVAQCLHALSFAAQHSACIAVITRHFPGRLRGRGQALYAVLGYGASGVIGGVVGGALSTAFGLTSVFWAASVVALAAVWCCRRALRSDRAAMAQPPGPAAPI
ncbi:MAG TPA: MFS transporter [Caldimonas sp.]|nr:MFS transporter [Caldimonas sp.]HEX4233292.1 MFS transporter [Caldimonas sp.]